VGHIALELDTTSLLQEFRVQFRSFDLRDLGDLKEGTGMCIYIPSTWKEILCICLYWHSLVSAYLVFILCIFLFGD
jgi:hypothetical protein